MVKASEHSVRRPMIHADVSTVVSLSRFRAYQRRNVFGSHDWKKPLTSEPKVGQSSIVLLSFRSGI